MGVGILLWNKLFLVLIYFLTAFCLYKICKILGWSNGKSKLCAILFLCMPIGFFVQFCLGLYDVITVFFMVMGIYFYLRDEKKHDVLLFVLFFALAVTCKSMVLLFFFPFLFVKEKRVSRIIIYTIGCVSIYGIYILMFHSSESFVNGVLGWSITELLNYTQIWYINPAMVVVVVSFAMAYFIPKKDEEKEKLFAYSIHYCNIICFAFYGLCLTHPNWFLLIIPFIVISLCMHKQKYGFTWVIFILAVMYFAFFANTPGPHSEALINTGVLGSNGLNLLHPIYAMNSFYKLSIETAYTFLSAALLVIAIFSHPKFLDNTEIEVKECITAKYVFLLGILVFVIPAFVADFPIGIVSAKTFTSYESSYEETFCIDADSKLTQYIYNDVDLWKELRLWTVTWNNVYDINEEVVIDIIDMASNDIIYSGKLDLNSMSNNDGYSNTEIKNLSVKKKNWYKIEITGNLEVNNDRFAIKAGPVSYLKVGKGYLEYDGQIREDLTCLIEIVGK